VGPSSFSGEVFFLKWATAGYTLGLLFYHSHSATYFIFGTGSFLGIIIFGVGVDGAGTNLHQFVNVPAD